jgi:hypothetical protein
MNGMLPSTCSRVRKDPLSTLMKDTGSLARGAAEALPGFSVVSSFCSRNLFTCVLLCVTGHCVPGDSH